MSCAAILPVLLAVPPASFGQESGVTIDPDSPSGKEYSLPLESAKDRASPQGSSSGGSSTAPGTSDDASGTRFGDGIERGAAETATDDSGTSPSNRAEDDTPASTSAGEAAAATSPDGPVDNDDGSPVALVAVGLLAAAAIGGGVMRWRGGRS